MTVPFTDIDKKYGFPEGLLASMWQQESNQGRLTLSPAGARGHFQFMPPTRGDIIAQTGLDPWDKDPRVAAECAGFYLSKQVRRFGCLEKALAAYNWGSGNVSKVLARGDDLASHLPKETRDYVPQILSRIGFEDRVEFTRRYAAGRVTDPEEVKRERTKRREILTGVVGMPSSDIDQMSDADLFGNSFLGMIASFIKAIIEAFTPAASIEQTVSAPALTASQVAAVGNVPARPRG
jgi:hypothetical protein